MVQCGKFPVRSKIIIEDRVLEQTSNFNYLGCDIRFDIDKDIQQTVNRLQYLRGNINITLKNKTWRET